MVFGALVGAMFWNVVTWLKGIPSSSSHALVGGIVGAGVAHAGFEGIQWGGLNKTMIAIVLSPMIGMFLAMLVMLLSSWALRRATAKSAETGLRGLHLLSSAAYSLSHGLNDAQKTMGIITVLLFSTGHLTGEFHVPHWVAIACYIAIALGTLSGRLADHRDDGLADHQAVAAPGIQRLDCRLDRDLRRLDTRHPGLDHAHDHRRDHRRGHRPPGFGGALGCRAERGHRLVHHHSRLGGGRGDLLFADAAVLINR